MKILSAVVKQVFFFLLQERNLIQSLASICLNFNLLFLSRGTFFLLDQKALLAATKSKKYRPETDVYFLRQAGVEADPGFLPHPNGRGSSKEISNILPKPFLSHPMLLPHPVSFKIAAKWLWK